MADWGAIIGAAAAIAQGYAAKKAADAQKADYNNQQKNYQDAMALEQERVNRARNSPFSPISFALLDQALRIYGDQSKGRGGFKLPVDSLSAMLGGYYPREGAPNSGGGQFGGGGASGPIPAQGWSGSNGASVSPEMRELIEQRKKDLADARALGLPGLRGGQGGGGRAAGAEHEIQRLAPNGMDDSRATSSGSFLFDDMFEGNYERRLAEKGMQRGLSPDDLRDAAWWYRGLGNDGAMGKAGQYGVGQGLGMFANTLTNGALPGLGLAVSYGLKQLRGENIPNFMLNYNDPGRAPFNMYSPTGGNLSGGNYFGQSTGSGYPVMASLGNEYGVY